MAVIPIQDLDPATAPPSGRSIRAIVTLCWPYSSSTKQCALLLAEPDFRLRSRKGQVRVRFAGASAEAVAKSRIGIGEEVVLGLNGAVWAPQDVGSTRTPGMSVDGELVFARKLGLKVARANGDVNLNIDSAPSPPPASDGGQWAETATPVREASRRQDPISSSMTSGIPIYSSPAFAKRLRLSGGGSLESTYDPFMDDSVTEQPRHKLRTWFGGAGQWRYAAKTPSPVEITNDVATVPKSREATAELLLADDTFGLDGAAEPQSEASSPYHPISPSQVRSDTAEQVVEQAADVIAHNVPPPTRQTERHVTLETTPIVQQHESHPFAEMLPPSTPRSHIPDASYDKDRSPGASDLTADKQQRPTTPELLAVPNLALPLPSPFPMDALQTLPASEQAQQFDDDPLDESIPDDVDSGPILSQPPATVAESIDGGLYSASRSVARDDSSQGFLADQERSELLVTENALPKAGAGAPRTLGQPEMADEHADSGRLLDEVRPEAKDAETDPTHGPETIYEREEALAQPQLLFSMPEQPQTPVKLLLDGVSPESRAVTTPHPRSTPQSERDQIMALTYKSLFGFQASQELRPSPPREHLQAASPTPTFGLSDMARARFGVAAARTKDRGSIAIEASNLFEVRGSNRAAERGAADLQRRKEAPVITEGNETAYIQHDDERADQSAHLLTPTGNTSAQRTFSTHLTVQVNEELGKVLSRDSYAPALKSSSPVALRASESPIEPPRSSLIEATELLSSSDADEEPPLPQATTAGEHSTADPLDAQLNSAHPDEGLLSSLLPTDQVDDLEDEVVHDTYDVGALEVGPHAQEPYMFEPSFSSLAGVHPIYLGSAAEGRSAPKSSQANGQKQQAVLGQELFPGGPIAAFPTERVVDDSQDETSSLLSTQPIPRAEQEAGPVTMLISDPTQAPAWAPSSPINIPLIHTETEVGDRLSIGFPVENLQPAPRTEDSDVSSAVPATAEVVEPHRFISQATVIEIGSSSPDPDLAGSPEHPEGLTASSEVEMGVTKNHVADSPILHQLGSKEEGMSEHEVASEAAHVETTLEVTSGIHVVPDAFLDESAEPHAQLPTSVIGSVSYPVLPPSPTVSQRVYGLEAVEAAQQPDAQPEILQSVIPPAPQLTQTEPDTDRSEAERTTSQQSPLPMSRRHELSEEVHKNVQPLTANQVMTSSTLDTSEPPKATEASTLGTERTPSRKSLAARLSNVPDVISAWFSPKRSSVTAPEKHATPSRSKSPDTVTFNDRLVPAVSRGQPAIIASNGLSTSLGYFTPLSRLERKLNPASQQAYGSNTVDVIAVIVNGSKAPERAKNGPKDFFTVFRIRDTSFPIDTDIRVEVFRPWKASLPAADVGDVVLLRGFVVKSRKRQPYLLSTDTSAWCVWRYVDSKSDQNRGDMPVWARKHSDSIGSAVREEVKGPPVELGDEERQCVKGLREWWTGLHSVEVRETERAHEDADVDALLSSPRAAKL